MSKAELTSQEDLKIMLADIQRRKSDLTQNDLEFIHKISPLIKKEAAICAEWDTEFCDLWNRVTDRGFAHYRDN